MVLDGKKYVGRCYYTNLATSGGRRRRNKKEGLEFPVVAGGRQLVYGFYLYSKVGKWFTRICGL